MEIQALFGSTNSSFVANPAKAVQIINVQVALRSVADLTLVPQQRLIGTTAQELTGDWEGYHIRNPHSPVVGPNGTAPTQDLGEALFSTPHIEGFRIMSAKAVDQMNLVVFPNKLQKGSRISCRDHAGKLHEITGTL